MAIHEESTKSTTNIARKINILFASTALAMLPAQAWAQDQDEDAQPGADATQQQDDIVVQGIRQTIQNSIEAKRDNDLIVEQLVAEEIGDLPALSIGEALETLTS